MLDTRAIKGPIPGFNSPSLDEDEGTAAARLEPPSELSSTPALVATMVISGLELDSNEQDSGMRPEKVPIPSQMERPVLRLTWSGGVRSAQ